MLDLDSADFHTLRALLDWQVGMGATEAICEAPVDRYAVPVAAAPVVSAPALAMPAHPGSDAPDPVAEARHAAAAAGSLEALRAALAAYDHCELKRGARNLVFSDGTPGARVMIVGEAPGRDEDRTGRPFVGQAGQMLDRMLAAIGLDRSDAAPEHSVYITNVLPWRPPENRDPTAEEIAMMAPFLARHVELAAPKVLVVVGNHSAQALLGQKGITRLRGTWTTALGLPALPMFHPAYLLRQPERKREAWTDLLSLQAKLRGL
jgi:DNA polymerase